MFVSHLGDITESFDTSEIEWQRASSAMATLDAAGIPNNLAPGNHDLGTGGTTSNYYDQYFPPSRYDLPANPWYGGWLGEETGQVQRLNKDNYELFSASGIDFLIIHLEIDMPTYAVQWANEIVARYPNRQVILSTHAFLNTSGNRPSTRVTTRSDGLSAAQVWDQLVFPNCNIFMVVNGHYPGEGRASSINRCGTPVHQVITDYQSRANGGDGWLRYYTFQPTENKIYASTYSPKLSQFETDASSQFTLDYDMNGLGGYQLIGSASTASGVTAAVEWPNLQEGTAYDWYAVSTDGTSSVSGPTWSFTTGGSTGNQPPTMTNPGAQTDAEADIVALQIVASDPDGTALSYAASGLPDGLVIDPATGEIAGTLTYASAGSHSVTVTASDGLDTATAEFNWTVTNTNRAPVVLSASISPTNPDTR